jgi:hypothetical protein
MLSLDTLASSSPSALRSDTVAATLLADAHEAMAALCNVFSMLCVAHITPEAPMWPIPVDTLKPSRMLALVIVLQYGEHLVEMYQSFMGKNFGAVLPCPQSHPRALRCDQCRPARSCNFSILRRRHNRTVRHICILENVSNILCFERPITHVIWLQPLRS